MVIHGRDHGRVRTQDGKDRLFAGSADAGNLQGR